LDFSKTRKLSPLLLSFSILVLIGSNPGHGQQTDDEQYRRELFLKSRQKMEVIPSPTPTPRPTPLPAEPPVKHALRPEPSEASPVKPPLVRPTPLLNPSPSLSSKAESRPVATPDPTAQTVSTPVEAQPEITPSATPKKKKGWFFWGKQDDANDSIVIQKSGAQGEKDLVAAPGGGGRWEFLTAPIRKALDQARVSRNRWKYIIVHNSGTRQGNARIFDYYHRHVRKMPNGLAYHFVIGNGSSSGNGQIEIGDRWTRQLNGGHVHSDYLNYISLGICLVGDFNRDIPTKNQYLALDELIRYLRQRVGKVDNRYSIVRGHKEINPRPTDCPGARFPLTWLHRTFPD
jgi:hypothetical protein